MINDYLDKFDIKLLKLKKVEMNYEFRSEQFMNATSDIFDFKFYCKLKFKIIVCNTCFSYDNSILFSERFPQVVELQFILQFPHTVREHREPPLPPGHNTWPLSRLASFVTVRGTC
jgi:hypothetical protein